MDISQLVITVGSVIGILIVGLLAVVPSLLEFPRGADRDEATPPEPTPLAGRTRKHADAHNKGNIDLAA